MMSQTFVAFNSVAVVSLRVGTTEKTMATAINDAISREMAQWCTPDRINPQVRLVTMTAVTDSTDYLTLFLNFRLTAEGGISDDADNE